MTDKTVVVAALREEFSSIPELLRSLPPEDWNAPTSLPGWSVRDVAAHVLGTELALLGEASPPADPEVRALAHVRNDIGALNEAWVRSLGALSPEAFLARFESATARRLEALDAMSQADFDEPSWTPAGQADYGRFMQIRAFDCWIHEQDMRDGAGEPGHESGAAAEVSIDEITTALGYVVGKRAGAPPGSVVAFELTGGVERSMFVEVAERAHVVAAPSHPPTTVLRLRSGLFARLAGGRTTFAEHEDEVSISGDSELGRQVAGALAFTI